MNFMGGAYDRYRGRGGGGGAMNLIGGPKNFIGGRGGGLWITTTSTLSIVHHTPRSPSNN